MVFSQWTAFLSLLEPHLEAAGFMVARIVGSQSVDCRDANIARFAAPTAAGGCDVLLASLAVASVGIDLKMASQVVLTDSWWAPSIEAQAVPPPPR